MADSYDEFKKIMQGDISKALSPFWGDKPAEPVGISTMVQLPPEGTYDVQCMAKSYVQGTADTVSYWIFTCETTEDRVPVHFTSYRDVKNAVGEIYQVTVTHKGGGKYHARPKL